MEEVVTNNFINQSFRVIYDTETNPLNLFGPGWQKKNDKDYIDGSLEHCIICGRKTSPKSKGLGVIIAGGGSAILNPEDNDKAINDGGYMGWFAVGAECIKAIPSNYRVKVGA